MTTPVTDKELDRLAELGEPQGGDDDQMVVLRSIARITYKIAAGQNSVIEQNEALAGATGKCDETYKVVKQMQASLGLDPPDSEKNVVQRVTQLERSEKNRSKWFDRIAAPVLIAAVLGALGLAWNATVDAAAAQKHAKTAVQATETHKASRER